MSMYAVASHATVIPCISMANVVIDLGSYSSSHTQWPSFQCASQFEVSITRSNCGYHVEIHLLVKLWQNLKCSLHILMIYEV